MLDRRLGIVCLLLLSCLAIEPPTAWGQAKGPGGRRSEIRPRIEAVRAQRFANFLMKKEQESARREQLRAQRLAAPASARASARPGTSSRGIQAAQIPNPELVVAPYARALRSQFFANSQIGRQQRLLGAVNTIIRVQDQVLSRNYGFARIVPRNLFQFRTLVRALNSSADRVDYLQQDINTRAIGLVAQQQNVDFGVDSAEELSEGFEHLENNVALRLRPLQALLARQVEQVVTRPQATPIRPIEGVIPVPPPSDRISPGLR